MVQQHLWMKPMRHKMKVGMMAVTYVFSTLSHASFIETTMGTAIVNDATAAYFNPAALSMLKTPQIIPLGTIARFTTNFTGQTTAVATGLTAYGSTDTTSYYYSPSFYMGVPLSQNRVILGFAAVSNFANRNPEENSILRYVQSGNTIQDYDFVPSIGVKINDSFSVGGGVNFSYTTFHLHPIVGFPGTNIPDGQSNNNSDGSGIGANAGFLLRPTSNILIGFNYRTVTTYRERGKSTFNSTPELVSNNYHFQFRTPARSVLSVSEKMTPNTSIIATIQYIQWSIIRNGYIYNIATLRGMTPTILNAIVPYYLHNTWAFTLGGNYRFKPNWIIRIASTYNQSPDSGYYQISNGDSISLGGSLGYDVNKAITLDGSYAHAFQQNQNININGNRFVIKGTNQAARDVVSLKITFNL